MRKILLVDDNNAIAQNLAKLLQRRGYEVQIAATLAGARGLLKRNGRFLSAPTLIFQMAPAWNFWIWFEPQTPIFHF